MYDEGIDNEVGKYIEKYNKEDSQDYHYEGEVEEHESEGDFHSLEDGDQYYAEGEEDDYEGVHDEEFTPAHVHARLLVDEAERMSAASGIDNLETEFRQLALNTPRKEMDILADALMTVDHLEEADRRLLRSLKELYAEKAWPLPSELEERMTEVDSPKKGEGEGDRDNAGESGAPGSPSIMRNVLDFVKNVMTPIHARSKEGDDFEDRDDLKEVLDVARNGLAPDGGLQNDGVIQNALNGMHKQQNALCVAVPLAVLVLAAWRLCKRRNHHYPDRKMPRRGELMI